MLRKEKDLYIAGFTGPMGYPCTKVGISSNVKKRVQELNGYNPEYYFKLYARLDIGNDDLANFIEKQVYNYFPVVKRKEFLSVSPETALKYCRKVIKNNGIENIKIVIDNQFYDDDLTNKYNKGFSSWK